MRTSSLKLPDAKGERTWVVTTDHGSVTLSLMLGETTLQQETLFDYNSHQVSAEDMVFLAGNLLQQQERSEKWAGIVVTTYQKNGTTKDDGSYLAENRETN